MTVNSPGNPALDALAKQVMEALVDFHDRLSRRRFPVEEFDRLWRAVLDYSDAMNGLNWLHRDVAREFSGLREYLELEAYKTPGDVLQKADRMECILFAGYDPYLEDDDLPW